MRGSALSYGYVAALATVVLALNIAFGSTFATGSDSTLEIAYLCLAAALLNVPQVPIGLGRLSLNAIAVFSSALLLSPADATFVGIASSASFLKRGPFAILVNAASSAAMACVGALFRAAMLPSHFPMLASRLAVVAVCTATNLVLITLALGVRSGVDPLRVATRTFNPSFFVAFAYFSLAALVISYVLDGTALGYFLATIVCVLALALTDTISGRRVRRVLESELSDADRHLFHSRAVEGVVHNLRNHVATAVGYLKEIDGRRLDPIDRESLETATAAANDAVTVLRDLAQGATPRVSYSMNPVDLNELVTRAVAMARPRARPKEVQLAVRESSEDVKVRADPLLLREVITNLANNAIDAAPINGRVELHTGRRSNGWPYVSVADNGPGVPNENRHRLFEPHFTTKEGGTGLGLFMSFGVVREHQGELIYEGSRRGAIFTMMLPPFAS
ncbi:MAG: sensor histidine kinase [Candidatus Dormibacterales bacterium]